MTRSALSALALLVSVPAFAQTTVQQQPGTTTTVQSTPGTTTVQTQPPPPPPQPAPGTQVVVNPPPAEAPPPATTTRVSAYETPVVVEEHRRAPMATIATDALYGGIAGLLVGGGIALLDNGDHWQRDLMIGGGAGILAGVGVGIVQVLIEANDTPRTRAAADQVRPVGGRAPGGTALALTARW